MLSSVEIRNFTVFPEVSLRFSPSLNVIVGENGSGKSHILKAIYSILAVGAEERRKQPESLPVRSLLQTRIAEKLVAVLRPELLGRLARRKQGRERCEMRFFFREPQLNIDFSFATNSRSEVGIDRAPEIWLEKSPVFLPTRELLTIYPNFVSVYENHYLEFEETWRDTCILLGAPALRGPTETRIKSLLRPLEKAMDGKIVLEKSGRFYLNVPGEGKMEITLVAEGLTKLGMLARLIATGALLDTGYLFWDEPDTSLNPKLVKQVANSVVKLCQGGIQIFLATHSLFLMRELDILLRGRSFKNIRPRFFGLQRGEEGVTVEQGDSANDIGPIAALEEELSQSDRYLETE